MKKYLFILFLSFSSLGVLGQTQKSTKVLLSINDCRINEPYHGYRSDTILFYKLPEDVLVLKIVPRLYKTFPLELENIPIAEYKLKYKNSFEQDVIDTINLNEQDINNVTLCTNTLLNYNKNTLSELQDNDSILINFHSESCFGSNAMRIVIFKKTDKFIASLYNISQNYKLKKHKISFSNKIISIVKTMELTQANLNDFIKFENEIKHCCSSPTVAVYKSHTPPLLRKIF